MYSFQRITGATSISGGMVTERGPSMDASQKIVGAESDVTLVRFQFPLV